MPRGFTVRLPEAQVSMLATLATYDGVAIAEEIRRAVTRHIESRSRDPEFVARIQETYKNLQALLKGVDGGEQILEALGGEKLTRDLVRSEERKQEPEARRVAVTAGAAAPRRAVRTRR